MNSRAPLLPTVLLLTSLGAAGCRDPSSPDGGSLTSGNVTSGDLAVQLLYPPDGAVLAQDPNLSTCGGPGLYLDFDWSDATHPSGIAEYEIIVQHQGSTYPVVSTSTTESRYSRIVCGYVIDRNLTDWRWKVRAQAASGEWGEWTNDRRFDLAPCRKADGSMCSFG